MMTNFVYWNLNIYCRIFNVTDLVCGKLNIYCRIFNMTNLVCGNLNIYCRNFSMIDLVCGKLNIYCKIQDSRLLYYLIREIKTWLSINCITVHNNIIYFYILKLKEQLLKIQKLYNKQTSNLCNLHTHTHTRTHARTHTHTTPVESA